MKAKSLSLFIGILIAVVIRVILTIVGMLFFRFHMKRSQIGKTISRRVATITIHVNGTILVQNYPIHQCVHGHH